jgi:hypothetical protein
MQTPTTNVAIATTLEVMENKKTQSKFYVIGESENFKVGFRVWPASWSSMVYGTAEVAARFRFEKKDAMGLDVDSAADFEFGSINWTGGGGQSNYVSKVCVMKMEYQTGEGIEYGLNFIKQVGAFETMFDELVKEFPAVKWLISRADFATLCMNEITAVKPVYMDDYTPQPFQFKWVSNGGPAAAKPHLH